MHDKTAYRPFTKCDTVLNWWRIKHLYDWLINSHYKGASCVNLHVHGLSQLPCLCVLVLSNRRSRDRWLARPPLPWLSTAHAGDVRRSLRVCSVASVFLSVATGIGAVVPYGFGEASARRQNSLDPRGNTPHSREENALCLCGVISSTVNYKPCTVWLIVLFCGCF